MHTVIKQGEEVAVLLQFLI